MRISEKLPVTLLIAYARPNALTGGWRRDLQREALIRNHLVPVRFSIPELICIQ